MANSIWVQDVFSKGELAPSMYARVSAEIYYKSLKIAKNILPIPQGGARKRFALRRDVTLGQTDYTLIYPFVFDYLNECIYVIVMYNNSIDIYLEGRLVDTVATTIDSADIGLIDHSILETRARIATGFVNPQTLTRAASPANTITAFDTATDVMTITAITLDIILPVKFTTTGTLPSTPQIKTNRVYFIRAITTTTSAVYLTAVEAAADTNRIDLTGAITGTCTILPQNTWAFANITITNAPSYDFDRGYDALNFTPSVTTGTGTLTASGAIFSAAFVKGLYHGAGGVARLTGYTSPTVMNMTVIETFSGTAAVEGIISALMEPAWSNARGWPRVCSSYQTRSAFANSESLPNGVWLSAVNDYDDFDDSTTDADQGIAWYPSTDVGNFIKYLTPFRSLVVHTDTGIHSTPVTADVAVTPLNFTLTRQDDTPTADIQPVTIDNQIFVTTGVDVNSLLWEFGQYSYSSSLISAVSEHLITDPGSMAAFRDQATRGGRYVFIANKDTGRLAMFQSLISEEVAGWTWAISEQEYGAAYFRHVLSSVQGRCWFIMERRVGSPQTPVVITAFDAGVSTLTATASNFSLTQATQALFTIGTTLPATVPQIAVETYYYAVGVDANDFRIYIDQDTAVADINAGTITGAIAITDAGTTASVVPYTLSTILTLEEHSTTYKTDSAITATVSAGVASGLDVLNGQVVSVKGTDNTYDTKPVIAGSMNVSSMGVLDTAVTSVEVGLPIKYNATPLPISIPTGQGMQTSNLAQAKHIRFVNAMFTDTVGGKINNQNIALKTLITNPFNPVTEQTGLMQYSVLAGWDDFMQAPFAVTQEDPYDFILIGLFYNLEV